MTLAIRPATPADAPALLRLFRRAVRIGAAGAYTIAQRRAWAPGRIGPKGWRVRQNRMTTLVAEIDGRIAGFTEFRGDGHVHMLHVDPAFARRGVARALLAAGDAALDARGAVRRSTWASRGSRPVFERAGYRATGSILAPRRGQRLISFRMVR